MCFCVGYYAASGQDLRGIKNENLTTCCRYQIDIKTGEWSTCGEKDTDSLMATSQSSDCSSDNDSSQSLDLKLELSEMSETSVYEEEEGQFDGFYFLKWQQAKQ